jgi:hypothetical protein
MARWYASFDNSTVSGREAAASDGYYERVAISNGSTLRAALISTRAALSAAAYAQINSGNQDGTLGIVVPTDVVTRGGGNYSWTNLYQNVAAEWPSDPRVRPTAQILSTDPASSAVSPTDAGTISDTLYTDAQTALENCFTAMTGGGPRGRIGLNPWRTLASIFHDHGLNYLAWDDFTPGAVQGLTVNWLGATPDIFTVELRWSWQFPNDANIGNTLDVLVILTRTSGDGPAEYRQELTYTGGTYPTNGELDIAGWPTIATGSTYSLQARITILDVEPFTPAHAGTTVIVTSPTPVSY